MKRLNSSKIDSLRSERGTALGVVLFITFFSVLLLGVYLSRAITQHRVNDSSITLYEARSAAEGVAEFAVAEIARRASSYSSVSVTPLTGYTLPLSEKVLLSPEDATTHVSTDPLAHVIQSSLQFKCSDLSPRPANPLLLNENDPVYKDDLDAKNISASVRACNVFGMATALTKSGRQVSSYVAEHIQIREVSWLNYAVFYNMDMEFHAGPNLTINGPVHTNADAYVAEGSGAELKFLSSFSAKGKVYRLIKYNPSDTSFGGTCSFQTAAGASASTLAIMDTSHDSRMGSGWLTYADNTWKKYVRDVAFGVTTFAPDGMPTYTPEDFSTTAIELRNNAALIIEPQLSTEASTVLHTSAPERAAGNYYPNGRAGQKSVVDENSAENIKFSALAGMTIKVEDIASPTDSPRWKLLIPIPTTSGTPVSKQNLPQRNADGTPRYVVYDPWAQDELTGPSSTARIKRALKRGLLDAIQFIRYREGASSYGNGTADLYPEAISLPHAADTGSDTAVNYYAIYDRRQGNVYGSTSMNALMGAYHVLRIDLGKLNTLIQNNTSGLWVIPADSTDFNPPICWTGVVYVEMPLAPYQSYRFNTGGDRLRIAQAATTTAPGYAVVLSNCVRLPRLASNLSVRSDGFTIATNGPLYIQGHYNADGNLSTGSSSTPDAYANPATLTSELPALVAADSVTVLSAAWGAGDFIASNHVRPDASDTEISAAIITGLVPTHPGLQNIWSAGVHNLVRYQEDWGGATYRYRGSLAAIYESEVSKQPYHEDDHSWYSPPTRDMGYHQYLAQGWFPPGTPIKRTVRRMDLEDIDKATYTAGPVTPPAAN